MFQCRSLFTLFSFGKGYSDEYYYLRSADKELIINQIKNL